MEALTVSDRRRLANRLRFHADTMKILSRILGRESESNKHSNDRLVAEIQAVAEELFPLPEEHEELRRDWDMENTFVIYNRGDVFATLHEMDTNEMLALSLVKYDQANYSVDVVCPERISRRMSSTRAWNLMVDHMDQGHRLSAQKAGTK